MADIFDNEKRSEIMRKVKSKKNKSTELWLIDIFKQNGITGWKRNYPVKGHPDFVFQKEKIAVFVDGCFWHGHNCRNTRPSDNRKYWKNNRIWFLLSKPNLRLHTTILQNVNPEFMRQRRSLIPKKITQTKYGIFMKNNYYSANPNKCPSY